MPFKKMLRELVENTPGASGAILTDWEGEAVEQFTGSDEYELKIIGAHKVIVLNRIKEIEQKLSGSELCDVVISTESHHILMGAIDKDYSLVMITGRDALVGCALHQFRRSMKLLKKEIS